MQTLIKPSKIFQISNQTQPKSNESIETIQKSNQLINKIKKKIKLHVQPPAHTHTHSTGSHSSAQLSPIETQTLKLQHENELIKQNQNNPINPNKKAKSHEE